MNELHKKYQDNLQQFPILVEILAGQLGVSVEALTKLEVGLNPKSQAWVFPERDEKGNVIGISQRLLDGKKIMVKGSKRGLTYIRNREYIEVNYESGKHNWTRVSPKGLSCPLCRKRDGCLIDSQDTTNPKAVVCVHISEGSVKPLKLGHLHILRPEGNLGYSKTLLIPSEHPILIVEGASDVAYATDIGFTAIGKPSANGGLELLAKLVRGKEVVIIGEHEKSGAGIEGMEATFKMLESICMTTIKILPPDKIKDLRQWKPTQEELLSHIENTGITTENPDIFENDIAHTIAQSWLQREKIRDECLLLRNYRSQWIEYRVNHYEILGQEEFRGQLYKFLEDKSYYKVNAKGEVGVELYRPTRSKVTDIIDAMNHWCPIIENPPVWLEEGHPDPVNLIAFQNGILDVQKFILNGEICMYNATPKLFTFNVLPYDYDENAHSKVWDNFVKDIYNDDKDKIRLLSQWFGYNCIPDLSQEKLMLFTGRPRSGKSTVLETMQAMLGEQQCCETSFQSLSGSFGYQPLLNKFAAIIGDAKSPRTGEANAVLEKILHITGGDAVSVNRKGISELPMIHLKCRFTIAMNDLPTFTDHARALEPRLNILTFTNSYVGREDRTLKCRLRKEAQEGKIINFALQGLRDLYTNGIFLEPDSSKIALQQFQELASPVVSFTSECCEFEKESYVLKDQLYDVWRAWCESQGRKPGFKQQFCRWFMSSCPEITTSRKRFGEKREYAFEGVKLSNWVLKELI